MVKWIREWITDPEVGVQVEVSKQESLEYTVKYVGEGVGVRVCKEELTWKIRWVDGGDGKKMREG